MKTLLTIRENSYAWVTSTLQWRKPLLLPICNKPFVEFLIDFAVLAGSRDIRLLSDGSLQEVEQYCENGSRWGVQMSYAHIKESDDLQTIFEKNRRFCNDWKIMVIDGFVFIGYDKKNDYSALFNAMPDGTVVSCAAGSMRLITVSESNTANNDEAPVSLNPIDSVESYYDLSMHILRHESSRYVLPGYGSETDSYIGRNVTISKSAEIIKPVSIGNNVQILAGSVIGPGTVIGSNVIIDRKSRATESIVLDNTYIGEELDVEHKIAIRNTLISPPGAVSIAMEDPHLLTGIKDTARGIGNFFRTIVHDLTAIVLILLLFVPFILITPILAIQGKWRSSRKTCYDHTCKATVSLPNVSIERSGPLSALAFALSLDRFSTLFRVISGRLSLIGNAPMAVEEKNSSGSSGPTVTPGYRPAVFSYAEAENWPISGNDAAIVERFYAIHSNPLQDIGLTMKSLINRFHDNTTA
ncbi:NDP-sugar synthase [Prosthecochloris sp.]|uniref:NDP-sugar synthase n=1 Tax=Prosthecochloris sp. TaxID=290513 RepID=UPI00257F8A09|nr:NDP-sugar synthase [Prosthecochloris sp.]